jgi:hypothetical protein
MPIRQNGLKTWPTVAAFKADNTIAQQLDDQVQLNDVLSPGVVHTSRVAGAETPDDVYMVRKTNDSTLTFWASSVNTLIAGNASVPFGAIPDNAEEVVPVAVPNAIAGEPYVFGVISGKPAGVELIILEVNAGEIVFLFKNNTGSALTAGTVNVNIYE